MNYNKLLSKYNKKYLYQSLPYNKYQSITSKYKFFFIIPVFNEYNFILDTLQSINKQNKVLLKDTLVINEGQHKIGCRTHIVFLIAPPKPFQFN